MSQRVLFINNAYVSNAIPDLFSHAGFHVDTLRGEEAGLKWLAERGADVIIVREAPDTEGWRFYLKIRCLSAVPLIIISPGTGTEACVRAINAGADFFLRKPFGPLELVARVRALLRAAPVRDFLPVS